MTPVQKNVLHDDRCAGSAAAARPASQQAEGGATPTPALHDLRVCPMPTRVAKAVIERHHYLHSLPGGTKLAFGAFVGGSLLGAITFGVGPFNAPSLVAAASEHDCLTLTRLWLSDDLPPNSESRTIGILLRSLRKHTPVRFLLSYADPSQDHLGTIYQATNWLYTGLSEPMPLYDIGDGKLRHSRSLAYAYGSHSVAHFRRHGVEVRLVAQQPKHRYVYFLDPAWRSRLLVPVLLYPKKGA